MSSPSLSLPRRFGRYALFDFIGRGGMAEIFLARAESDFGAARLCVVKEILPAFANDPAFADMLIFEAKLAARLSHANIVQVFDLGRFEDRLYIAMEYIEGYDLNGLLRACTQQKIAMPLPFVLHVVAEALRGLDYAHRAKDDDHAPIGIVHRDVSPSNILVSLDGEVKVCDFGIAHANDIVLSSDDQESAAIRGKAGYMSPEHARGEALDARADVFAAGIVLWELLSGKRMYKASNELSLLDLAKRAETPALVLQGLPEADTLRAIVMKALAPQREQRFATAAEMLRELEDYSVLSKLPLSAIRFGEWLHESFGDDAFRMRRVKEQTLTPGPVVTHARATETDAAEADAARELPAVASVQTAPELLVAATPLEPSREEQLAHQEVTEPLSPAHFARAIPVARAITPTAPVAHEAEPAPTEPEPLVKPVAPEPRSEPTDTHRDDDEDTQDAPLERVRSARASLSAAKLDVSLPAYNGPLHSPRAMRAFRKELAEPSEIVPPPSSALPPSEDLSQLQQRRTRLWAAITVVLLLMVVIVVVATR